MSEHGEINMSKCSMCGEEYENCVCADVAKFFQENGHLMKAEEGGLRRDQEAKKKFYFIEPSTHRTH